MLNGYKKIRRIVGLCMGLIVLLTGCSRLNSDSGETVNLKTLSALSKGTVSDGKYYVEDDTLALCADTKTGRFELTDKSSGKIWYSVPTDYEQDEISKGIAKTNARSHLLLEYISRQDENTNQITQKTNSYAMCEINDSIAFEAVAGGFKLTYDFEEIGIKIPVTYFLNNGGYLSVSINVDEISENDEYLIVSVGLLPFFGAAGHGTDGYLFIPDGSGTVAEFNSGIIPSKAYEKMVYGEDLAHTDEAKTSNEVDIRLPVFGTVYDEGNALMSVITAGDGAAAILAQTGSDAVNYNTVYSKMIYRIYSEGEALYQNNKSNKISTITHTELGVTDYTVRYYPLSGENASYSGMANKYREYLVSEQGLQKTEYAPSLALRAYGSLEVEKNLLGIHYYDKQSLTSYSQLQNIAAELKDNGVNALAVQYVGWSANGVYNRELSLSGKPLNVLGGSKDFSELNSYMNKQGFELYPDVDILTFSKGGNGVGIRGESTKAPNGDNAKQYQYSTVTYEITESIDPWYLLSPKCLESAVSKLLDNYSKTGASLISLSNMGNSLYSDFKATDGIYRSKSLYIVKNALDKVSKADIKLAVSGGNAYSLGYSQRVFEAPVASSGYDFFTYDVPFYQMVLYGYVNYTTPAVVQSADNRAMLLKAIETGSDPLFACIAEDSNVLRETRMSDLFSSGFDSFKKQAVDYYTEYSDVMQRVSEADMLKHTKISEDVYRVDYSNGIQIFVNYSDSDYSDGNVTVSARGYFVREEM